MAKLIFFILIVLVLIVLIIGNSGAVPFRFLTFSKEVPLIAVILAGYVLGFLTALPFLVSLWFSKISASRKLKKMGPLAENEPRLKK